MKTIPLNKGMLQLPETWDELTYEQKLFALDRLWLVFDGTLSPAVFRIEILGNITGYKPQADIFIWILRYLMYCLAVPFAALYHLVRYGRIRFPGYWSVWKYLYRPKRTDREVINYNLYKLSEMIDFAFTVHDRKVTWKRSFANNPIPYLDIQGRKFTGRKFMLGVAPFTNITAREFSDCFDLYSAYLSMDYVPAKEQVLDKIISILYPASDNYSENMVSEHTALISTLPAGIMFGILYWFSGIVEYYISHPYYSILFRSGNDGDQQEDKIRLGMNEIVLMIKKKGYDPEGNINDFFDAQLKILKDNLSEALAKGVKIEELASKTGMSTTDINRLI